LTVKLELQSEQGFAQGPHTAPTNEFKATHYKHPVLSIVHIAQSGIAQGWQVPPLSNPCPAGQSKQVVYANEQL